MTAVSTRWWFAAAIVSLLLGGGIIYWLKGRRVELSYITAPVTRGVVARAVTATGTVNPVLTVTVGSYVSGVIRDQYCDFNTRVRVGQLCAKIDPRPYQTVVNQDRANLANAKAQLVKDQANLTYDRIAYQRDAGLVKRGIVSQDTVDSAKSALDQALAQIEVDKAVIQQAEAALDSAQVNLGYTNIISPVDGTVVSRSVTIGQTVAASFQTPTLFLIATDLTQMEVDTNVSESDVGGLHQGDKATFVVEAYPNRTFAGKVLQFRQAPQTVQNVVTYDVIIGVRNDDHLLEPGMTATARIVTDQRDGYPMHVSLKTGLDDDSYAEVIEGDIHAGDQVIIGEAAHARGRGCFAAAPDRSLTEVASEHASARHRSPERYQDLSPG